MLEQQQQPQQQPSTPSRSNRKWIALGIAGCALILCAGVVAIAAIPPLYQAVVAIFFRPTPIVQQIPLSTESIGVAPTAAASLQKGNTLGDPNAPVKLVEYADFQCPYCMRYWKETEPQIIEQYVKTGKVYYEYHSVGAFIGPESGAAAQAAYCAGDQGQFWQYHDALYSHWTGENVGDFAAPNLKQFATTLGLDRSAFDTCLDSGKYASRIQQDVKDARAAGVQATPSFLINGQLLEGAQPFAVFQQAIEAALKGP